VVVGAGAIERLVTGGVVIGFGCRGGGGVIVATVSYFCRHLT